MTDPWARPADDGARPRRPPAQTVEIQLDGPDRSDPVGPTGGDEPNRRAVAGTAVVVGVVLGLVIAGVLVWNDSDDDQASSTTIPVDEPATEISTPATLPPVETVPPTTIGGLERMIVDPRSVTVPTYPPSSGAFADRDPSVEFDTLATPLVADLVTDSSMNDAPVSSQVRWDVTNRRFELSLDLPVGTARSIYDVESGTWYDAIERPRSGPTTWTTTPADRFPPSFDPFDYFTQLLLGPVRADNADQAIETITSPDVVDVRSRPTVRTTYRMPASALGLWGGDDGDVVVPVDVFTDEHGRIVRSQLLDEQDPESRVVVHSPERADVTIELPTGDELAGHELTDAGSTVVTADSLRPVYETVEPVPANSTGQYSIAAALDHRDEFPPAAASVDVRWADNTASFVAQRDDENDRRLMSRSVGASTTSVQIDDAATATTFVTDDVDGVWTRLSSTGPGGRLPPVDERMVSGLVTRSSIEGAEVLGFYRYVVLRDGTVALEANLEVAPGEIVLPSVVPMTLDPAESVEIYLYVGSGVVHELHVLSNRGEPQVLVQRFDLRADPEIALPDPSRVAAG